MEQTESRMGRWMKQGMLFLKWLLYSAGIGLLVGGVAAAFHLGIDWAAELRVREPWILWLLPVGGMAIVLLYRVCRMEKDQGTNLVLAAVREAEPLKLRTAPLIFLSTIVTHLVGGSAGREGAALQLGGTLALTALVGLFLPMGAKDCAAAAAGFGWYSLAPTLLAPYSLSVSATAFLSNIMHELLSIVAVPAVAQRIGYIEAVALPGATAMDTVLPVVVSATSDRMALYSFTSGAVLSLSVPFLVPAIIALPF